MSGPAWFRVPAWCSSMHDEPRSQDARAWVWLLGAWAAGDDPSNREVRRVTGFGGGRTAALLDDCRAWARENGAPFCEGRPAPVAVGGPLFDAEWEEPGPLTHADVVERAVRWLRGKHQCRTVFAEMVTSLPITPDAIGWYFNWSVLIEAKVSRSDFRADRSKPIHATPDLYPGQERWYLTPPGLVRPDEVPDEWGLAECGKRSVRVVKPAGRSHGGSDRIDSRAAAELPFLLSAHRRHELGVTWREDEARFAPHGSATGEAK